MKQLLFYLIFFFIFLFIYDLNKLYPVFADDWDYSYIYWYPDRISNIFDVFKSQAIHYVKWGGRIVLHGILQELLYFGSFWSDLLNSLMFIIYVYMIYKFSNWNKQNNPILLIIIFLLIWIFQVNLGETVLWLSGSANYLWGTTIVLLYLYMFYGYYNNECLTSRYLKKINSLEQSTFFFITGIVAGWTNENTAAGLIFMIIIFLYLVWNKTKQLPKWVVWGVVGCCIGLFLMYIAPGNFVRYKLRLKALGIANPPPAEFYIDNFYNWLSLCLTNLGLLIILFVVLAVIFVCTSKVKNKKKIFNSSLVLFSGAIISTLVLIVAPEFSDRMLFGVISLIIISILILYNNINLSKIQSKTIVFLFILIGAIYFFKTYKEGRDYLVYISNIVNEREKQISEQKAEGKIDILLTTNTFDYRPDLVIPRMIDLPIDLDSTKWLNQAYCRYYGIRSKKIINTYR